MRRAPRPSTRVRRRRFAVAGIAGAAVAAGIAIGVAATPALPADVQAELDYARAHWRSTSNDEYGYLADNDCMNFASQALRARGWAEDADWHHVPGDPYSDPKPWISSTAFRDYLAAHPGRATALTDAQRDRVKPGDLVQFDWDGSGDRDHTGIVTSVEKDGDGRLRIRYAGHTDATWDRDVDEVITTLHPGALVFYWSIHT